MALPGLASHCCWWQVHESGHWRCRYPGSPQGSRVQNHMPWLLSSGRACRLGGCRYDVDAVYDPRGAAADKPAVMSRFGTFVAAVHAFDAAAFGISPLEAQLMDPQQRILLEETAVAAAASGKPAPQLLGASVGVYVGCIW